MDRPTAVLEPGKPVTLPPAGNISFEIEPGQRFGSPSPRASRSPI